MWSNTRHVCQIDRSSGYSGILNWFRHKTCESLIFHHCQFDHLSVNYCSHAKNDVVEKNMLKWAVLEKWTDTTLKNERYRRHKWQIVNRNVHFYDFPVLGPFTYGSVHFPKYWSHISFRLCRTFRLSERPLSGTPTFGTVQFLGPFTFKTVHFRDYSLMGASTFPKIDQIFR